MKLVYLSNSRMPTELAHGLQVAQMCSAFSENNCDVLLLVPRRVNKIKEDIFSYYGIEKKFVIKKIPCIDFIFLHSGKIFFWIQTLTFLFFSRFFLLFKKYDILYTREQAAGLFFNNFALEIHSLPKKITFFHTMMWRRARILIVLTSFIKERLIKEGLLAEKIHVAADGVDISEFDISISKEEARSVLQLPVGKKLIGYVGMLRTLGMEKGIDIAIKALSLIKETQKEESPLLVLVGGYSHDIDFYKKMARELGIDDNLICIGRVSHNRIPLYLKAFDCLIAPFPENEHYSYFMSPMKLFEYMASKRPIITTNLPSIREILDDQTALILSPADIKGLANGIVHILKNSDFGENLALQAFSRVKEYTWQKRAQSILNEIID